MIAPISTMPRADLKLILCSSSQIERLLPMGTFFICMKLKYAQTRPNATANTIKTIKIHIKYKTIKLSQHLIFTHNSPANINTPTISRIQMPFLSLPNMICYYLVSIVFKSMEDDSKSKAQLALAFELYNKTDYAQSRKVLGQVKTTHASIELNLLLCQYKEDPRKAAAVIKKLMDILIAINIKLYEDRPTQPPPTGKQKAPKIAHELYYWNIAVLSQILGSTEVTELIITEALHFTDSLRTQTCLMLIYQMLNVMQSAGRLASCIALIEKQNRLLDRVRNTSKEEQTYRFINQILFNKVLLKLGMIEGSKTMYSMRFTTDKKEDLQLTEVSSIPIVVHQQLLNAQIEYHAKNYPLAIKILSQLLLQVDGLGKNKELIRSMIDHNLSIVLCNYQKSTAAQFLLRKSLNYFTSAKELTGNNERSSYVAKCKQNIILSGLLSTNSSLTFSSLYELLRSCGSSNSYKFNYRKAQLCLKYYHELLANPSKVLPSKEIHDFYETVYFYPNQPYFQQKGKNKNPNFTNGRSFYRRYLLPEWENTSTQYEYANLIGREKETDFSLNWGEKEKEVKQEPKEKKKDSKSTNKTTQPAKKEEAFKEDISKEQKVDPHTAKLREALNLSEWYLKQALSFLEKEKTIIVNLQGEQKGLTEQVNEKLYSEYIDFKASIYSLLCYVHLCKHQWTKVVHYASIYQQFQKQYQLQAKSPAQQQVYYSILTYKMEAQCELGRTHKAYDLMQDVINSIEYAQSVQLQARSTANQQLGQAYLETMSQYNNFCFNISVLHSRDNKIPEAFQAIQKILQLMRISPSSPQAKLPMSMIDLLIHYNLRTGNNQSALQMIKRRRILNVPGVIPQYQPTLNITK